MVSVVREEGFTYLGVLLLVALLGAALAGTATVWHTMNRREKERELLFIGQQFRQAIGSYYRQSPGGKGEYPGTLEDLLLDKRQAGVVRHLRRIWRDPMTGSTEWGLVRDASGRIMGVYSLSTEAPLKTANFDAADRAFEGQNRYTDWKFVYEPPAPADEPHSSRPAAARPH